MLSFHTIVICLYVFIHTAKTNVNATKLQDYVHIIKLARNMLLNHRVFRKKTKTTPQGPLFSMKTIWQACKDDKELQKHISMSDDLFPIDKMDVDPVLNLTDPAFTTLLKNNPKPEVQEAVIYLSNIRAWYEAWNSNKGTINERLDTMQDVSVYFDSLDIGKGDVAWHMSQTYQSLEYINFLLELEGKEIKNLSALSTLVVENLFSQVSISCMPTSNNNR